MAKGDLLKKLVSAHVSGDETRFRDALEALIKDEQKLGHHLLAEDLHSLIQKAPQRRVPDSPAPTHLSFLATPNRHIPSVPATPQLYDVTIPETRLSDLVLAPETEKRLCRILEEYQRAGELAAFGLRPKRKLLFIGPPGCGKTYGASMLAGELGLPLVHVRVDAVVSSYLGETAANLRRVFDFSLERPCVLFFDEFDSVGADRGNPQEVGELRRVVNSFLQLMDSWNGRGLIIAATNYEALLDEALWRRFEDVISFDIPTASKVAQYLRLLVRGIRKAPDFEPSGVSSIMMGLSYSQIRDVIVEAIKSMVLSGDKELSAAHIREQIDASAWRTNHRLIKRRVRVERDS